MKSHRLVVCLLAAFLLSGLGHLLAGPSLPVTKPPVQPGATMTGPPGDPFALQGQWFMRLGVGGEPEVRTHEFYDDEFGGFMGTEAIYGYVNSVTYQMGPGSPIIAFSIMATVFNDTTEQAEWEDGDNSHGESLQYHEFPYVGTLHDVKLTAEFAILGLHQLPSLWLHPYRDRQPYIVAENPDQAAWYCWNPQLPGELEPGNYYVPTWDFGDIPMGESATRQLDFVIPPPGLDTMDSRYEVIVESFMTQSDILLNRSTSLKISTWIDELFWDIPDPEMPLRSSNVSVFHNIEEEGEEPYMDFGDAPPPYPTLLIHDGARHIVDTNVYMGQLIDAELDGIPHPQALGDDLDNLADEDGVVFITPLIPGQPAHVDVTFSVDGYLSAWIDFNANGSWADPGDQVFAVHPVTSGVNRLAFHIPAMAQPGATFARFRFTSFQFVLSYFGLAEDGEVEDYMVMIQHEDELERDFGDAPDPYPTLLANNGARHVISAGVYMGAGVDAEPDGQPDPHARGDDHDLDFPGTGNIPYPPGDEDGVELVTPLVAGMAATVRVTTATSGYLSAWIDFDADGSWAESHDQVFHGAHLIGAGVHQLLIHVPASAALGDTFARFRFTTLDTPLSYDGLALDGEVEDYRFTINQQGPASGIMITNMIFSATPDLTIEWNGESGVVYEAQYTDMELTDSNLFWTGWGGYVDAAPYRQTDTNPAATTKFYRVIAPYVTP